MRRQPTIITRGASAPSSAASDFIKQTLGRKTTEERAAIVDGVVVSNVALPAEPIPLTVKELALYIRVPLSRVEELVRVGEIATVAYKGETRVPFSEYESRATSERDYKKMIHEKEIRFALTSLVAMGMIDELDVVDGHTRFVISQYGLSISRLL